MGLDGTREALNRIRWNMGGTEWDQMEEGTEWDQMEQGRH